MVWKLLHERRGPLPKDTRVGGVTWGAFLAKHLPVSSHPKVAAYNLWSMNRSPVSCTVQLRYVLYCSLPFLICVVALVSLFKIYSFIDTCWSYQWHISSSRVHNAYASYCIHGVVVPRGGSVLGLQTTSLPTMRVSFAHKTILGQKIRLHQITGQHYEKTVLHL